MKHRLLALTTAAILLPGLMIAKTKNPSVAEISRTISDESIIYPESFETNTKKLLEGWYMKNYTATDNRYSTLPDVPVSDDMIIKRLQAIPAVVEMPFNPIVRQYIERYTKTGRPQVAAILGLNNYYLPIFEQALEQEGLPLELKYLPMIESGLDPNAVSKHGATGLWQFMLAAAKGLGLEVNSLVDERRDPYLSSATAAKFLKDLYATYNDWSLAIAAYNCGPGTVNKAIRRAGGDPKNHNFWSIYKYLPAETRGYVPMFIAANYVMNYYKDHNISPVLATKPLVTDTIGITSRVHFDQISNVLNIPVEELRVLNPQFRADVIPGRPDAPYFLILPSQQIHAYIMSEADILAYNADQYKRQVTANPDQDIDSTPVTETPAEAANFEQEMAQLTPATPASAPAGSKTIKHKVKPQESLASIAQLYNVQPEQIKEWNGLRRNQLRTGTILNIVPGGTNIAQSATPQQPVAQSRQRRERTSEPAPAQQTVQTTPAPAPAKARKARANATAESQQPQNPAKKDPKSRKKNVKKEPPAPTTATVRNGDSLERIAKREGVTVDELRKANNLSGENPVIQPGQKLNLPKKGKAAQTRNGKKATADEPAPTSKTRKGKKSTTEQPASSSKTGKSKKKSTEKNPAPAKKSKKGKKRH